MARRARPPSTGADAPTASKALSYVSGLRETWYLHEGVTKTGKPRYFVARTAGAGALAEMPAGREFRESVGGVVSVARVEVAAGRVAPADVAALQAALKGHPHLLRYKAAELKGALVVYEPEGASSFELSAVASMLGLGAAAVSALPATRVRYRPVLRFEPAGRPGAWSVSRWVFRGDGWWHGLGQGPLLSLAREYLPALGTDAFYELM